jgi:4-carboxymuconolactone decarboxylase
MRVPYGTLSAEELAIREREGTQPPNLQRALANAPDVARLQLELLRAASGRLDVRRRELAILEHARLLENAYCWGHHVPPALHAGFTKHQLRRLRKGDHSAFEARDRDVLAYVGAFESQTVTDEQWAALRGQFSDEELVALTMLIGCYAVLGRIQRTLDVPQDEGFAGFEAP